MMVKKLITLFLFIICFCTDTQCQRLVLSDEELQARRCDIVESYFEYKKHISIVSDEAFEPFIRNASSIALSRLLHHRFTTTDFTGQNREKFIESLKNKTNNKTLLKKTLTVFDCPNFDFVASIVNDEGVQEELELMNIIDQDIKTTKYKGWMLFAEEDYTSYRINKSWMNSNGTGITKNATVKKLWYEIYPLDSITVILNIRKIEKVKKVETRFTNKKNNLVGIKYEKVKPEKFKPCCEQPEPIDEDGDDYNIKVDCDDGNIRIYPGAPEIIADGIDQDCDGEDQLGEDKDKDGFYYSACFSSDPEIRKLCDCFEDDPNVYFRDSTVSENEWYFPDNGWNDDNCDCVKDRIATVPWEKLSRLDYIIPGKGHFKRGPSNSFIRKGTGYVYSGAFLASTTYAIYSKVKSNSFYNKHLDSETFRLSNDNLAFANKHNKRFLKATGVSALIFAVHFGHLYFKDKRQEKYKRESIQQLKEEPIDSKICYVPSIEIIQHDNNIGIGLIFNLN